MRILTGGACPGVCAIKFHDVNVHAEARENKNRVWGIACSSAENVPNREDRIILDDLIRKMIAQQTPKIEISEAEMALELGVDQQNYRCEEMIGTLNRLGSIYIDGKNVVETPGIGSYSNFGSTMFGFHIERDMEADDGADSDLDEDTENTEAIDIYIVGEMDVDDAIGQWAKGSDGFDDVISNRKSYIIWNCLPVDIILGRSFIDMGELICAIDIIRYVSSKGIVKKESEAAPDISESDLAQYIQEMLAVTDSKEEDLSNNRREPHARMLFGRNVQSVQYETGRFGGITIHANLKPVESR